MGLTPGIDAMDVGRAFEVIPALVRFPPAPLAGDPAGLAALRLRTVPLVVTAAWIGIVQLMAAAALAPSATLGHVLLIGERHREPKCPRTPTEEDDSRTRSKRKKTQGRRRRFSGTREEDPTEEEPFQTG